jgi:hypothetical protein
MVPLMLHAPGPGGLQLRPPSASSMPLTQGLETAGSILPSSLSTWQTGMECKSSRNGGGSNRDAASRASSAEGMWKGGESKGEKGQKVRKAMSDNAWFAMHFADMLALLPSQPLVGGEAERAVVCFSASTEWTGFNQTSLGQCRSHSVSERSKEGERRTKLANGCKLGTAWV